MVDEVSKTDAFADELLKESKGLKITRFFTKSGINPLDQIEYELRSSVIKNTDGSVVFQMNNIEVPKFWSQVATDILAQKYFRKAGVPQLDSYGRPILDMNGNPILGPETSIKQVVHRLAGCWTFWGKKAKMFATEEDAQAFYDEVVFMLVNQFAAPNSPQWFNTGLNFAYGITGPPQGHYYVDFETGDVLKSQDAYSHPQVHACADYHTIIYTDEGPMFIGEIVEKNLVGKKVFDGEKFVEILATKYNGKKKLYKIKTKNGNFVELTADHLVLASEKSIKDNGKYTWIKVQNLKNGMKIVQPVIKTAIEKDVDEKELAEARLVGWIIGDGAVGIHGNVMKLEIVTINEEEYSSVIKDVQTVFGNEVNYWVSKFEIENKSLDGKRIHLTGKKFEPFVYKYNLLNKTSRSEVPELILRSSSQIIKEFLKALFQTNGCVRIKKCNTGNITLTTVSEKLAFQVLQLLNSLGIYSRISVEEEKRENKANPDYVMISYGSSRKLFQQLIGFISTGKSTKMVELDRTVTNSKNVPVFREETIINIEEVGTRDVYDIQTESGRFLANGIVVHNCYIQPIKDDLVNEGGIMDLWLKEARIFKYGSGTGTNFSNLRGKGEPLSGGGKSSGLMSFLKIGDRAAGAIKSGGTTRRAAKMVILNLDHPDIEEFINWKVEEEKKVAALIAAGYSSDYEGEAYLTVSGQNSNNSVRVPNKFMKSLLEDGTWDLRWRTDGRICKTLNAKDLWEQICTAAWSCADPGLQFDTTINEWHTCPESGRINASNPCSEYMFLDNTACNLASMNLLKFFDKETATFDVEAFKHATRIWTIVLEISIIMAQQPSKEIAELTHKFRTLGLGYTNLGSLLMIAGIPYDSDDARAIAAAITAMMTGESYATSAEMAKHFGPFPEYAKNKEHMLRVIRNHRRAAYNAKPQEYEGLEILPVGIDPKVCPQYLLNAAVECWDRALDLGEKFGFRNAQTTLIAPTGTISLLMDCDTTGIEPDFALVKFKKLAGGGYFKIVNQSVTYALKNLGYTADEIRDIIKYMSGSNTLRGSPYINMMSLKEKGLTDEDLKKIEKVLPTVFEISSAFNVGTLGKETMERLGFTPNEYNSTTFNMLKSLGFKENEIEEANDYICGTMTIEGAPHLKEQHYAVFDCANKCGKKGKRFIHHMAHIKMMAATQPFLSGSISKTINMPNEVTVDDIKQAYLESWKLALKSIAIYRDGSKLSQPLAARTLRKAKEVAVEYKPMRRKLPDERKAITHKFQIGNQEGYITVGIYDDGSPGELFIVMSKEGSIVSGLVDSFATAVSIGLQYGVPLRVLVDKFTHTRFEPAGVTNNPEIRFAKSIMDYVFRWLALKFLPKEDLESLGIRSNNNGNEHSLPRLSPKPQTDETTFTIAKFIEPKKESKSTFTYDIQADAPPCHVCGSLMIRSGSCYVCLNCGANSGCV